MLADRNARATETPLRLSTVSQKGRGLAAFWLGAMAQFENQCRHRHRAPSNVVIPATRRRFSGGVRDLAWNKAGIVRARSLSRLKCAGSRDADFINVSQKFSN
jgi:hypothetical protein